MLVDLQINFSDYFYPREMKEILQKYGDTDGKEWDSIKDLRFSDVSEKLHNGVYQFWDFNGEFLIDTVLTLYSSFSKISISWRPKKHLVVCLILVKYFISHFFKFKR